MIENNIKLFNKSLSGYPSRLIVVSKTQPMESLQVAYTAGQRIFGENKAQEMQAKSVALPKDIEWHMIGHLQTNKVKYIAQFVSLIHSVDSIKLLEEIDRQGKKVDRTIDCLLQIYIANEETKFGFSPEEAVELIENFPSTLSNIKIIGLMGMATFTSNQGQIRSEFKILKNIFENLKSRKLPDNISMLELSMGMSSDYKIALEEGSTLIRIGTAIFGERNKLKT